MTPHHYRGLTSQEAEKSRLENGNNLITPQRDDSVWKLLAEKFGDPMIRVLLFAAALSLAIGCVHGDFTESVGIIAAILLATLVGFLFEYDARRRFRRLNKVNDDVEVKVLRDDKVCHIARKEVVCGDVVFLESGETVPADGELLEAVSLRVNESTLTGELEVAKSCDPAHFDPEATYPTHHLLRGTSVTDGYGVLRVTAVGDRTEAGKVTEQATTRNEAPTPLNLQLTRLSKIIGRVGISLSVAIFTIMCGKALFFGDLLQQDWLGISQYLLHVFMLSVAIIVMAVPEGLPMSITLSLAMSMRRMLKTNNLVRKMHACETMGAVTVICTDKTGTLTQNRMSVSEMKRCDDLPAEQFAEIISANTTAFLGDDGTPLGNPTECALLGWLTRQGFDYRRQRETAEILSRETFSTERKYMATLIRSGIDGRRILCVKGAPEIVLRRCRPFAAQSEIEERLLDFQNHAMRTLAIAWKQTEAETVEEAVAEGEWTLSAVAAIADPVREEVKDAVRACLDAGIAIKIVTGDTPATAREIARQIALWDDATDSDKQHLSGVELAAMSDDELLERVGKVKIISRARPLDKQRLVKMLQRRGEVVAVTGDGTNDAPALNFAHVGLSMGSGTSVAKDASDITLLDDSFSSIATAVMWGRSLYRNIQRFVLFQLTINFVAILICFVGALFETDIPLTVVQILWVNIIMDTFAAMAMASLPPSREVMGERPRKQHEFVITREMAISLLASGTVMVLTLLGMLLYWHNDPEGLTVRRLTLFFTTFVFFQFWNMFNARGFASRHSAFTHLKGCREFLLILLAIGVGQFLIVETGGEVFRTTPLTAGEWLTVIGATSLIAIGGEAVRTLLRRR